MGTSRTTYKERFASLARVRYDRVNDPSAEECRMIVWWTYNRLCCCYHSRLAHLHYRRHGRHSTECSKCPCERFQWRLTKWIY